MNYYKFTEHNDNEGETWNFFFSEENLKVLAKIHAYINQNDMAEQYEVDLNPVPESEVDILVKHSGSGYMPHWNKIEGQLDESKCLDFDNYFYKGQFPLIK